MYGDSWQNYENGSSILQDTFNMTDFGNEYIKFISDPIK